jgi:hypothetical protein
MDATRIVILATIINTIISGLVGGIVIYVIQRKIDATIQKSLFEYQTKYSAIHSRRVETLETLYQKFIAYKTNFENMMTNGLKAAYYVDEQGKTRIRMHEGREDRIKQLSSAISTSINDNDLKFKDFRTYFEKNRIYLSPDTCSHINAILTRYDLMEWAMQIYLDDVPEEFLGIAKSSINILFGMEMGVDYVLGDSIRIPFPIELARKLSEEVEVQSETLQDLYKSIAEAQ